MSASVTATTPDLGVDRVLRGGAEVGRLPDLARQRPGGRRGGRGGAGCWIGLGARDEGRPAAGPGAARHAGSVTAPRRTRAPHGPESSISTGRRLASPMKSATKRVVGPPVDLARARRAARCGRAP